MVERDGVVGQRAGRVEIRIGRVGEALVAHVTQRRLEPRPRKNAARSRSRSSGTGASGGGLSCIGARKSGAAQAADPRPHGVERVRAEVEIGRVVVLRRPGKPGRRAEVQRVVVDARAVHIGALVHERDLIVLHIAGGGRVERPGVGPNLDAERIPLLGGRPGAARDHGAVAQPLFTVVIRQKAVGARRSQKVGGIET